MTKYLMGNSEPADKLILLDCDVISHFIANNALEDLPKILAPYCNKFNVLFLGTLDILSVAAQKGFYEEDQCDRFIQTALKFNKASFPKGVTAMRFYTPGDTSFI